FIPAVKGETGGAQALLQGAGPSVVAVLEAGGDLADVVRPRPEGEPPAAVPLIQAEAPSDPTPEAGAEHAVPQAQGDRGDIDQMAEDRVELLRPGGVAQFGP